MEDNLAGSKRSRNDDDEVEVSVDSHMKRIRADFLLEILDDESEPDKDGSDPAIDDLDSVMRSFEEEIATLSPGPGPDPVSVPTPDRNPQQPDLGFLLEASDDELGLPPAGGEGDVTTDVAYVSEAAEAVGFGKIWDLDDEIDLDFGFGSDERDNGADDGAVIFDGGLFDTWRPEFTPAA